MKLSLIWKEALLSLIGFGAGSIVAGGVFAFLVMIGVFPRLIGKTGTKEHIYLYDMMIVAGGIVGNWMDLYQVPLLFGGQFLLGMFGGSIGIFVGCLVMSLAETLKALPVMARRIRLKSGLPYVVLTLAAGKLAGALLYFGNHMSE